MQNINWVKVVRHDGSTLAHIATVRGTLPPDFNQWGLADKDGWTVAHEAAKFGNLPKDFDKWDITDKYGRTVRKVADEYNRTLSLI